MKVPKWLMLSLSFLLILESVYCMDPVVAVGVISAIVGLTETVKKYTIDGDDGMSKSIEDLKKATRLTHDTVSLITNQMSSLNTQLTGSTLQIMNELKFKVIQKQINIIDSAFDRLVHSSPNPSSSPEFISSYFNTFIKQFQEANPDFMLMHALESDLPGSKSLVDTFIEKARYLQRSNTAAMRTSSNKLVYELFSVLGLYIGKAYTIMNLCIMIRKHYSPPSIDDYNDETNLNSRLSIQTIKFETQMRNALNAVANRDDYVSYVELNPQKAVKNQVRMKMVLQNYLEYEPWLSSDKDTCSGECEDYKKIETDGGDGCYGKLRNCKFKVPVNEVAYTALAIQIGKLMPLAMIDQKTIHWQDVPDKIGTNYIEFGYDSRKFSLDDVSLDSKIMTGVRFIYIASVVSIEIFGQFLYDIEKGVLDTSILTKSDDNLYEDKSIEGKIVGLREANPDYMLMHALESDLPGSKSLVDTFIEKARHNERSNTAAMRTSSNKLVYELFSVLGLYIGKAYCLMNLSILMRKHYSPPSIDYNDETYLNSRLSIQTIKFKTQMRNALNAVDNHDDYVSYVELNPQKAVKNQVRMKMVLQNYLEYEPWLSSDNDTCAGECEDYIERDINGGDGCYGKLRNCKFKVPVNEVAYTAPASDPTSQIYNGYGVWPDWNGHGSFDDTLYKVTI
ncbi:unnamed protein product [Diamesa serratosioi]